MKKNLLKSMVVVTMVANYGNSNALELDDFLKPAVGIAATAVFIVTTPICYFLSTKNHAIERLEKERLLLQEKTDQEKQKKREEAQSFLHEVQNEFALELEIVAQGRELTQEEYNARASIKFNHQTPFAHLRYARKLQDRIDTFSKYSFDLADDYYTAEALEKVLKKVFEKHNFVFKNVLAKELGDEKVVLAEQQKRAIQADIDQQKLEIKIKKAYYFEEQKKAIAELREEQKVSSLEQKKGLEELKNQAKSSIESVAKNVQESINNVNNNAALLYANYLAHYNAILISIRTEFDENGYHALSKQIGTLNNRITQALEKFNSAVGGMSAADAKELKKCVSQVTALLSGLKNSDLTQNKELYAMIMRIESSLAVMAADVGDIKSGNKPGEFNAPPRDLLD